MAEILSKDTRVMRLETRAANEDGTIDISFSSETDQVERWFGIEILSHEAGAMDMTRAALGLPFLLNHDPEDLVGRVENIHIGPDRKGRGTIRFSSSPEAQQIRQDMIDGIRPDISVGYIRMAELTQKGQGGAADIVTVTRWMPFEITSAAIPADISVGAGRTATPGDAGTPTTPPAAPAGTTTKEGRMDPILEAAQKAAEDTKRALEAADQRNLDERTEALKLQNLATRMGLASEASEILASGKPLTEARALVMDLLEKRAQPLPAPKSLQEMGASEQEVAKYSYARLLDAAISQQEGNPKKCMELDIAQDIKRSMPSTYKAKGDFFAPFQLRAAMDSKTATAGKELVFTQPGELIELLRSALFIGKLGARFLTGLRGPIGFSKQTGAAIAAWIDENGGVDAAETEATTGLVTLTPKTLIGTTAFSRQLLVLGTHDAELMVRQDLAFSHAAALDLAAMHGTGGTQPTGIYALAGVNSVAMGGNPTFAKLVDMLIEIAADDAILGNIGYATTPRVAGKLMQTLEFAAAGAKATWTGAIDEGMVAGYKAVASSLIKSNLGGGTNEHGTVCGAWNQMIVGQFGNGFELITDPYAKKKQGLIEVTSFEMADLVVRHAESFTKATGVILT